MVACKHGRRNVVKDLISTYKSSVHTETITGVTCLLLAAIGGSISMLELLVSEYGADVMKLTTAPLHYGCMGGPTEAATLLASLGVGGQSGCGEWCRHIEFNSEHQEWTWRVCLLLGVHAKPTITCMFLPNYYSARSAHRVHTRYAHQRSTLFELFGFVYWHIRREFQSSRQVIANASTAY